MSNIKTNKSDVLDNVMVDLLYLRTFARVCEDNMIEIIDEINQGITPVERLEDVLHLTELNCSKVNNLINVLNNAK
ncbi:MAG: hypothetical protein E6053_03050 [Finegoldia magna]|uniref:hypothetical protein n=1 Tax=Finegoldia magna TaxID=1260 RepID=UPI000B919EA3|nr:hypothetical protein [Finegoldia magna]MDU2131061.1 hypothetical protein [Finegoldia magna]MDU5526435.1 hypothetical protein [Finegoldia magna]OXZ36054.1 hypothetical protein B9N53_00350 [Finegoldia magna]UEB34027.1 hypothetical protein LK404_03665 [Finegoldia magna]